MKMALRDRLAGGIILSLLAFASSIGAAFAEPRHGIAMYGEPALPPDFVSLPYANPDAPKGGTIVLGMTGGFDSLNPFILKGNAATGITVHTVETLMARSIDEPFTLYGLLAESVDTPPDRSWVEFTLRPEARFSDGAPVTVEDVIWSLETLGTKGAPRYQTSWAKVDKVEKTGERTVRITFKSPDRELPLLMGLRPILSKADWKDRKFTDSSLDPLIGSGPYLIDKIDPGRSISFRRNPDYWGKDLPVNRGLNNFDEIRYDYYADGSVLFQAFTAGDISIYREGSAQKWLTAYDIPPVRSGEVVKEEIPHQRPSGIEGLVMNTRNPVLADWRVRQALMLVYNFEFISQTLDGGADPRIASYFSNSFLAAGPGPAKGRVAELLAPYADSLLPGTTEGYALPVSKPDKPTDRANLRRALKLLEEAGWTVEDGVMRNASGEALTFEILLQSGAALPSQVVDIYVEALKPLGITPRITTADSTQYKERTDRYSFDMAWYSRALSLSPGNEQTLYWGANGVRQPGSRNWMGMDVPAAEAMIATMVGAQSTDEFIAATQALDRILTAGRYVIPNWYSNVSRLAYTRHLHHPAHLPVYGDWPGFLPDVWWYEE